MTQQTDTTGHAEVTPARLNAILCEGCGKPIQRGQFVHCYDDAGEVHVNCDQPNASTDVAAINPRSGPVFILAGEPLRRFYVSSEAPDKEEAQVDEARVQAIYDALPKKPNAEAYYSLSAIRLIIKTNISLHAAMLSASPPTKGTEDEWRCVNCKRVFVADREPRRCGACQSTFAHLPPKATDKDVER